MKRLVPVLAAAALLAGLCAVTSIFAADDKPATPAALNFKVKDIDGKDVDLAQYSGKVIMMVNVASKCGNTHEYKELEAIYAKYKDKGFVVMGFPANNFGGQEPGTNAEIKEFCTSTFQVEFPMFSKVSVKGADTAPLFKFLTSQESKPLSKGDIKWNFEKFLIDRNGKLIGRFENRMSPDDPSITAAIETALASK